MNIKDFFMMSSQMGGTKAPEKSNLFKVPENIGHNVVDATLGTVNKYISDILDPAAGGVMDLLSYVNPDAWRQNGASNLIKPVTGLISKETMAVKNSIFGIIGGIQNIYKAGIQDSMTDLSSGTFDRVPYIGKSIGNVMKAVTAIPALIPDGLTWMIKKGPDKWMESIDNSISPTGGYQPNPVRLRV